MEYVGPFNVETYEMGVWDSIHVIHDFMDALHFCSNFINNFYWPEERIRLIDKNNRVI